MGKVLIIISISVLACVALLVWVVPEKKQAPVEPPCSELNWMRDLPQKRCVEYWKQRNLEEGR